LRDKTCRCYLETGKASVSVLMSWSSALCTTADLERWLAKSHLMLDILRNTGKNIFKKQNPEADSSLPLLSGERDRHLPSRMYLAELAQLPTSCWSDLPFPRDSGSSDKEAVQFLDSTVRVEESCLRGCCRQVVGFRCQRSLFVCGNRLTCRIRAGCC